MIALIRAELLKIRTTRTVYALLGGMLALVAVVVVTILSDNDPVMWRDRDLAEQEFLFVTGSVMWVFVLLLGLRSFTDEFRYGSIVPTLLANPHRRRVLVAKTAVIAVTGLLFAVAAYSLGLAIGLPRLASVGAQTGILTNGMVILVGKAALSSVLWAALGVGLGLVVRHQVAAIVGSFVWIFIVETVLEGPASELVKYLPVHSWIALAGQSGDAVLGALAGGLMLAGWAAVAIAVGAVLMQRRDVA
jgi:ABC-2 type transport system permease protein